MGPLAPEQRLAVIGLQGLLARRQPRLWLNFTDKNLTLLEWHKEGGYVDDWETAGNWRALFHRFSGEFRGAVVPDPALYQGVLLACNVAACEDLIVASPELAQELGIPVKVDLRGRFSRYADGLRWVWDTYKGRLNHHVCMSLNPAHASNGALSYDIEMRSLIFWVSGAGDGDRPGADSFAERRVMAEIFAQLPPNIGIRGYPGAGEAGLLEGPGVRFFSEYAKVLTPTDHVANVCAMSGVQVERLTQPAKAAPPPVEKDKIYIALTMSDGDNLGTWAGYFAPYFEHPAHGQFPVGWGMGPAILDLMPGVAAWYFRGAKPGDEFLCDVSGIGYYNTSVYASRYREPAKVYDDLMGWTGRYMRRLGMETIRALGGQDSTGREAIKLDEMARDLPFCHSFFPDYARHVDSYEEAVFALPDGRPVFRALTNWKYGKDGLLRDVRGSGPGPSR
ncbi:MAG: GxGYxYP family putative glycoside hydrolase [Candidatus Sumerlaeota bacterium]|nr:GxGYxYP family putative glycoside hydrolase [Candidatus Sumerlaeota bacterium]